MSAPEPLHMGPIEIDENEERGWERALRCDGDIPRKDTAYRIALTLLFAIVGGVLRTVLGVIVLFELFFALVTRRPPGARVLGVVAPPVVRELEAGEVPGPVHHAAGAAE